MKILILFLHSIHNMKLEKAIFAAGCFWCYEEIFKSLKGVISVAPGYTGGTVINPTYEEVSADNTNHAEAIAILFNLDTISYTDLLDVFWHMHDPTTLNRQGYDIGTHYRSAIFYLNEDQKIQAEEMKTKLQHDKEFKNPIVTEITKATEFYEAEDYHKNYYELHKNQSYCQFVINPKLVKLREKYGGLILQNE